jgi:hypothetical protein
MYNASSNFWERGFLIKNPDKVKELRSEIELEMKESMIKEKDTKGIKDSIIESIKIPIENIRRDKEILLKDSIFKLTEKKKSGSPPLYLGMATH